MNTNTQHTPGPWHAEPSTRGNSGRWDVLTAGNFGVANVGGFAKEREHNARLIAAAPELYEALRGVIRAYAGTDDDMDAAIGEARAALANTRSTRT